MKFGKYINDIIIYQIKEQKMTKKVDTNNITEYGIKIVMDEEKILREGKYSLEEIYKNMII